VSWQTSSWIPWSDLRLHLSMQVPNNRNRLFNEIVLLNFKTTKKHQLVLTTYISTSSFKQEGPPTVWHQIHCRFGELQDYYVRVIYRTFSLCNSYDMFQPTSSARHSKYIFLGSEGGRWGMLPAIMGSLVWGILYSVILTTFISPPLWLLGLRKALLEAAKNSSPIRIDGVTALLWHVMRGTYTKLHSRAGKVMKFLLTKSVLTTVDDKFPDGQTTFLTEMYYCNVHAC
jgi:hypothetical protein